MSDAISYDDERRELKDAERLVLKQAKRYAQQSAFIGAFQVLSTLALFAVALCALWYWPMLALAIGLVPVFTALLVRIFVLQHDAGHSSLLPGASSNRWVGTLLSVVTGVPFRAWREEHAWHHAHQGKLHERGVDQVNSPMTVEEARARPDGARLRSERIRPRTVLLLGALSIMIMRKKASDFFMFRENFRHGVRDPQGLVRSVRLTVAAHAAFHVAVSLVVGWLWVPVALVAYSLAAMIGAMLFWLQHNFEHTWHAGEDEWSHVRASIDGASYLKLPWPLSWVTAHIGLHHVHHLNSRIPNYRLEAARREIDALAEVAPMTRGDVGRSFTHVFWDESGNRMVPLSEVGL